MNKTIRDPGGSLHKTIRNPGGSLHKTIRNLGGLLLALVLLIPMCATAFAYTPLDTDRTGSITVSPSGGQSIGTELTLYRVADVVVDDADQNYVLTEDFAASGADLATLDDAETLARTLSAYAADQGLTGAVRAVGTDGSVRFDDLELGLYLVIQAAALPGGTKINPFLVSVPGTDGDGGWTYDVEAAPKAGTWELTDLTVKKVWNDGNDTSSRPSSVTVSLYKDSVLLDTVKLDSASGWSYTWTGLEKGDGYSVREESVSGYAASYSQDGDTFTITNTGSGTGAVPGPGGWTAGGASNTAKLAQTGQLNWPIPLLAGCGLALFAAGWAIVSLKGKKDA